MYTHYILKPKFPKPDFKQILLRNIHTTELIHNQPELITPN